MSHRYYPLDFKPELTPKSEGYLQYAEVYKDLIRLILRSFSRRPPIHDYSLAPVLVLLRQYIELQLKGVIIYGKYSAKVKKTHDIIFLYREATKTLEEKKQGSVGVGEPDYDVEHFINALGTFDKKGNLGRYPETIEGESLDEKIKEMDPWLYERVASLPSFSNIARKVMADLEGMEGYLDFVFEREMESHFYNP